jgi:hypothetical protein
MEKKKIIIFTSAIILVAIIIGIVFWWQKHSQIKTSPENTAFGGLNTGLNSSHGLSSPGANSLEKESFCPNSSIVCYDSGPSAYQNLSKEAEDKSEYFKDVSFQTKDGKPMPLQKVADSLKIKINPNIYQDLDQLKSSAIFCSSKLNETDKGFVFKVKLSKVPKYWKDKSDFKKWEPTMFSDFKDVFFPQSDFADISPVFKKSSYAGKSGGGALDIWHATVKDKKGNDLLISYAFSDGTIYVADSIECMHRIIDEYEKVELE